MNNQPAHNVVAADACKGVLCAKCDHLNPPGSTACEYCRAALFEACRNCGRPVRRTAYRCESCSQRTRPRAVRHSQLWRRVFSGSRRITLWQVAALVVAVYGSYRLIMILVQ